MNEVRSAAKDACEALVKLRKALRGAIDSFRIGDCEPGDIDVLEDLIFSRLETLNAFELLLTLDVESAIRVLIARYVGQRVDPDRKFGGYGFELSTMLDDLHEKGGENGLRRLLNHPEFNIARLEDVRVIEAFSSALDIDGQDFPAWLRNARPE